MEKILKELPEDVRKKIIEIKVQNSDLYLLILKKIIRLRMVLKTGNIKLWEKIKGEEESLFKILLSELGRQNKVEELRKKIIEA